MNTGKHWICLSTVGCSPGNVNVFDSLGTRARPVATDHACRMLVAAENSVTMVNQKVQLQTNGNDCGLFAIAFATDICFGTNPVGRSYEARSLRRHLVDCIESQHMSPFPHTERRVPFHKTAKTLTVPIYCVCRLPNDNKPYVQCDHCSEWYHLDCVHVPEKAVEHKESWFCVKCEASE